MPAESPDAYDVAAAGQRDDVVVAAAASGGTVNVASAAAAIRVWVSFISSPAQAAAHR